LWAGARTTRTDLSFSVASACRTSSRIPRAVVMSSVCAAARGQMIAICLSDRCERPSNRESERASQLPLLTSGGASGKTARTASKNESRVVTSAGRRKTSQPEERRRSARSVDVDVGSMWRE
jgi:hypothetical protein